MKLRVLFLSMLIAWIVMYGVIIPSARSQSITGKVDNVTMTDADTEFSLRLPDGISALSVQCRTVCDIKLSFIEGQSGTKFFTIKSGSVYFETIISSYTNTIYFQSPTAGNVFEIIYWFNN